MAYMIGLPHQYDRRKAVQDISERIDGIECTQYSEEHELDQVLDTVRNKSMFMGIHFPLRTDSYERRDPLICDRDASVREIAFEAIEQELIEAARLKAKYLLIHFPKPMFLDAEVDWSECRFLPDECVTDQIYDYTDFQKRCKTSIKRLDTLAGKYGVPIYLELDLVQKRFYESCWLTDLLATSQNLSICLDTCRTVINASLVSGFDPIAFFRTFAPYTALLHVSNIHRGKRFSNNHHPVLPELNGTDGWGDVQQMLEVMQPYHEQIDVLFEHDSSRIDEAALMRCYDYVQGILEACTKEKSEEVIARRRAR